MFRLSGPLYTGNLILKKFDLLRSVERCLVVKISFGFSHFFFAPKKSSSSINENIHSSRSLLGCLNICKNLTLTAAVYGVLFLSYRLVNDQLGPYKNNNNKTERLTWRHLDWFGGGVLFKGPNKMIGKLVPLQPTKRTSEKHPMWQSAYNWTSLRKTDKSCKWFNK